MLENEQIEKARIKFVDQGVEAYTKEVESLSELSESEGAEFIKIFIRLKKSVFKFKQMMDPSNNNYKYN